MKKIALVALVAASVMAPACSKPDASALFAKGNEYFENKQFAEAIVQYRLASNADPKRGDVRAKLSEAYLQQRDVRAAYREAINAADLLPNDAKAQIKAGNFLLLARSFEDAKTRAEKAIAIDPKDPDALVLMGNSQAGLKNLDQALDDYQQALALNPAGDQIYANIGAIQASRGETREAEATFRKAVDVAPKSVQARLALAGFLWSSNRPADAETTLKEAVAIDPASLAAGRALGTFYVASGRAAEAEPYFKAIAKAANTDEAQLSLADYYLALRRTDDAKAILTPLSQKPGSSGPASLRLAAIEVSKNNRAVAAEMVRGVLEKEPKFAPARLFELRLLLMDNKLDQAMTAANALVKDEPNTSTAAEAHFAIGGIEASRDRLDDATKAYEEALKIQPQSLSVAMALAQLHLRAGRADKAETYVRQVLTAQPKSPAARAIMVRVYLLRNDLTRAAAELASLEKEYPNAAPVQNLVAVRDLTSGKIDAARAAYAKIAAANPNDLEALNGLVFIDLKSGRKKEATDRVEAALKRMAPSADLDVLAARTHAAAGNFTRAEELLKQAIDREPARLAAYGLLGQLYVMQKRLPDARDQFREVVKRNPQSVPANTMLGMLLEGLGDLAGAEAQYQKTLAVDQTAAVAANNLAWIFVASNRNLDQALELARTASQSLPDEPHVNDTLGWVYYKKGMFVEAVRHLELSVKRDATDPTSHYHLGMAYVQIPDFDKARAALKKALSMSQTFEGADEARKTLASLG